DWFTIHEKWMTEPPATLTPGTELSAKIVMLGMANKIDWTVDSIEAPHRLSMSGTGMANVKCAFMFTLEPAGEKSSKFTLSGDFDGALIKGALGKAVEKDGAKQLDKTLAQLTELAAARA
ncbi:MAG TPA: SRPBCC family protein, partial [Mycobacterium sp.]|nr:SRPBCC family protein [Mycobacterium sp.]